MQLPKGHTHFAATGLVGDVNPCKHMAFARSEFATEIRTRGRCSIPVIPSPAPERHPQSEQAQDMFMCHSREGMVKDHISTPSYLNKEAWGWIHGSVGFAG